MECLWRQFAGKYKVRHAYSFYSVPGGLVCGWNDLRAELIAGFPRGTRISYCRCFLPDLTGFITCRCAGPSYQLCPQKKTAAKFKMAEREGFEPSVRY